MYQSDFLEILWLLKREKVKSDRLDQALQLLRQKRSSGSTWKIERRLKNLTVPVYNRNGGDLFVTRRASEVLQFYDR